MALQVTVKKLDFVGQIDSIVPISLKYFHGLKNKEEAYIWMADNFSCRRMQYFAPWVDEKIVGYVLWVEHGGFRKGAYFELEQIAVMEEFQGKGIGTQLITDSFEEVKKYLQKRGDWLKTIKVTTGENNLKAQSLYRKILGAEIEVRVQSPYRDHDFEVEMYARFSKPA